MNEMDYDLSFHFFVLSVNRFIVLSIHYLVLCLVSYMRRFVVFFIFPVSCSEDARSSSLLDRNQEEERESKRQGQGQKQRERERRKKDVKEILLQSFSIVYYDVGVMLSKSHYF